jgi:hypothetical protein
MAAAFKREDIGLKEKKTRKYERQYDSQYEREPTRVT